MSKTIYIFISILFTAFILKAQANAAWQTISKQEATDMIEHSRNWFQTTNSYSFTLSYATYAGHEAVSPYEKENGYFKKYAKGFHSCILGIHTFQNKNYLYTLDTAKHIIIVSNPVKSFDPVSAGDIESIQNKLDICSTIKVLTIGETKTLRLEFVKKSSVSSYEYCLNKEGLPKSITICYANEVKSAKNGAMVKPKLIIEIINYKTGVNPTKDELNESGYFYKKDKDVLVLSNDYKKYSLLDQRVPTNNTKK
ncbi:MAG: hypothetical protein ACYDCN_00970 [Bacteroidia bacterium]